MSASGGDKVSSKFERVFEQIDDLKTRVTKIEVFEDVEKEQLRQIVEKLDELSSTLNQIIGKDSIRAAIYGVVGSIVAAVVAWLISLVKGNS